MKEVAKSFTAIRLMIDNTPTTPILENAERLPNGRMVARHVRPGQGRWHGQNFQLGPRH